MLQKTSEECVQKWKAVMPRQARGKVLQGVRQEEVILLKWGKIVELSPYVGVLGMLKMHKQERQQQPRLESGSRPAN